MLFEGFLPNFLYFTFLYIYMHEYIYTHVNDRHGGDSKHKCVCVCVCVLYVYFSRTKLITVTKLNRSDATYFTIADEIKFIVTKCVCGGYTHTNTPQHYAACWQRAALLSWAQSPNRCPHLFVPPPPTSPARVHAHSPPSTPASNPHPNTPTHPHTHTHQHSRHMR